jgi:hypothetical protein
MMFDDSRITDPVALEKYAQAAREIYIDAGNLNIEIAMPPVAIKFNSGAKVMCWLPVSTKPYIAEAHRLYVDEAMTPIEIAVPEIILPWVTGVVVQGWLPIEDEDVWE